MAKSFTNIWTYVIVMLFLIIFISTINILTTNYLLNSEADVTDTVYAQKILNINLSGYSESENQIEASTSYNQNNNTGTQTKDNALEFFYSRSVIDDVELTVKGIYSFPGYVARLLNISSNSISWLVSILNWFWRLAILIATYLAIRGIWT